MAEHSVGSILAWLNQVAPFDTQEEFDNSGLQVGDLNKPVDSVVLALDLTREVIEEAAAHKAQLIITHHPLMFVPQRTMDLSRQVPGLLADLIRRDIALVAVHTNMDQSAEFSASSAMARLLGLQDIRRQGGYLFLGELPQTMSAAFLKGKLIKSLDAPVRLYGQAELPVTTLAVAGGAYSEGFEEAIQAGAQALLTGEVRHHHAVEAAARGLILFDGGHYATEAGMLPLLALGLQNALNTVQYSLQVYASKSKPYGLQ